MTTINEADVEQAGLAWLAGAGWCVAHGLDIAPDTRNAERADYGQVVLEQRLRDALAQLNPDLPATALDDAFRRLTRPEGATLEARNRSFHRMLVEGVTVEYRAGGAIRGAQANVIDFDRPPPTTTSSPSISSPSPRTAAPAGPMSSCSSTACPSRLSRSRTRPTRTPPSGPPGTSSRPTRPSCRPSSP